MWVRQLDWNMGRATYDNHIGRTVAPECFQNQKEFFRKHGCDLAEWLLFYFSDADCRKMRLLRLILHFAVNEQF